MVAHQHPGMNAPAGALTGLGERVEKEAPVVVMENGFAAAPCRGSGDSNAKPSCTGCPSSQFPRAITS